MLSLKDGKTGGEHKDKSEDQTRHVKLGLPEVAEEINCSVQPILLVG